VRFAFKPLPGIGQDVARPALPVAIVGPAEDLEVLCLVDTGSIHNLFATWVGEAAGVDLANAEVGRIAVAGSIVVARTVTCTMRIGDFTWDAPVSFCDPWPFDFHIAGQLGFLRWFRIVLDAVDETFEVIPNIT
jgi:hypothetical protein